MTHRFKTLDGIRGIAAIVVMLSHLPKNYMPNISVNGSFAVDLFFCLSGFVIAFSYWNKLQTGMSFGEFLIKRIIRLYPMFFIGICIGAAVLIQRAANSPAEFALPKAIFAIALNAAYLPYLGNSIFPTTSQQTAAVFPTNEPAWSLFFELAINMLFAVWLLWGGKRNPVLVMATGMLGVIVYVGLTHSAFPGWGVGNFLGGFPRTIFGFYSGVYIYFLLQTYREYVPKLSPLFFLLIIGCLGLMPTPNAYGNLLWLGIILGLIPIMVTLGAVSESRFPLIDHISDYLGWISYPVYCLHVPIFLTYSLLTRNVGCGWWSGVACVAVTIVVAHLATKYIEEPVRVWLSLRSKSR